MVSPRSSSSFLFETVIILVVYCVQYLTGLKEDDLFSMLE